MGSHALLHPTEQTLSDFSLGKLNDGQAEVINNHLGECPDCQRLVAEMSSDSFVGRLRGAAGQPGGSSLGMPAPIMSEDPGHRPAAGTLPPDLADHPDYQIVRELGRGGMGVVYLAHNRLMGRDEVLKVVSKHVIERKGVLERFSREIRSAARLMHPNIVHAYSAFRCAESIVFAMEYVDGLDLAKLVKSKGPMSVAHASYFVHQAALGLQHAHEQGMVHRDIKPGNLMLTRKGDKSIVKVLDFGLAKATRESPLEGALTHEGQMLGTPDFIAPEQIRDAQSAGIQADIYSLGCTLYYLLTGGPPFEATSLYDLLQAHFSMDAQPLNLVRPEVPAELAALVAKMMAKDLERRFQTPVEVAEALKPFFKKGGPALKSSDADVSRAEYSTSDRPVRGAVSTPRQLSMNDAEAIVLPTKATEPATPEAQWNSLIDLREAERPRVDAPTVARRPRPRWLWPAVVLVASVFGLLVALGVVLRIKTPNGTIELRNLPNNADVFVDDEKVTVRWLDAGGLAEITVAPGDHMVAVKKDGFTIKSQTVTVERAEKTLLIVELESRATSPQRKGDDGPVRTGLAAPPAPPPIGAVGSTSPTPPPIPATAPDTNPTVVVDSKPGKIDPVDRAENEPAQTQVTDAARALMGKAEFHGGRWLLEGSELVQTQATAGGEGADVSFGDINWTNYDLTVDLRREKGDQGAALRFRNTIRNDDRLVFGISRGGRDRESCTIWAIDDEKLRTLREYRFRLVDHKWYRARVSVRGNHIACTLHDDAWKKVVDLDAEDDRHPNGRVALATENSSYRFKNIKVTAPDGKILWELPPAAGSPAGRSGREGTAPATRVGNSLNAVAEENPWPQSEHPDGQNLHISYARILCMSSDCRRLALQVENGDKEFWLRIARAPEENGTAFGKSADEYGRADFSPDGKHLAVGSSRGIVWVWDVATGREVRRLEGNTPGVPIPTVKYSRDGKRIASAGWDSRVRVWDASTGKLLWLLNQSDEEVIGVAFSPDGALIAIGHEGAGLELWNPATSNRSRLRADRKARIRDVAFDPSGRYIASASPDKVAQIWDVRTLRPVSIFDKHPSEARFVRFSPDGRLVASGGDEEAVRVWEAATGREVAALKGVAGHPNFVQFSPRGHWIFAGSEFVLKSWPVPPLTQRGTALERRAKQAEP